MYYFYSTYILQKVSYNQGEKKQCSMQRANGHLFFCCHFLLFYVEKGSLRNTACPTGRDYKIVKCPAENNKPCRSKDIN